MSVRESNGDRPRARPGRPRSEESRLAVLRATSELLLEVGVRAMTTEEIAKRSGARAPSGRVFAQLVAEILSLLAARGWHRRPPVRGRFTSR